MSIQNPRYIFIGGTLRGFKLLQILYEKGFMPEHAYILKEDDHEILKKSTEMLEFCVSHNIPAVIKKKLSKDDQSYIKELKLEFIIVCGWRTLIDTSVNESLSFGMIAAHDSLLPKYRGFAPLNWTIINGEKQTGVSLFLIKNGDVDSGPIIVQKVVRIEDDDYAISVYQKVIDVTIEAYLDFFDAYISGDVKIEEQDEKLASYTCSRTPEDGKIIWDSDAYDIYNLIRALAPPYTGAFFYFNNEKIIACTAEVGEQYHRNYIGTISGRVISVNEKGIEVLCKKGTLFIKDCYSEGRGDFKISDVIKSIKTKLN